MEPVQPKSFSVKIDMVDFDLENLEKMGEEKLSEFRAMYKLKQEAYTYLGLAGLVVAGVNGLANSFKSNLYVFDTIVQAVAPSMYAFSGFVATYGLFNSLKNKKNKEFMDQAIVMVTQDMDKSLFSSTKTELVNQGYFQQIKSGEKITYKPV